MLTGLKRLNVEHVELIHGSQLRAADRLINLYSVLVAISVLLVGLRFQSQVPVWGLVLWALGMACTQIPLLWMRGANRATDYSLAMRSTVLMHGALSFLQGLVWVAAMIMFTNDAAPEEVVTL